MKSSLKNPDHFFAANIYDITAAVTHDTGDGFCPRLRSRRACHSTGRSFFDSSMSVAATGKPKQD